MARVVVIGAGVAGLASAALAARDGHEVVVMERGSAVGGRAALVERDGFAFDAGPSWYLMPEVFEHFFRLCGTTAADELDLVALDPAYSVFPEPEGDRPSEPVVVPRGRDAVRAVFEALEPGAGEALERHLDSAWNAYALALRRFLYNPFRSWRTLVAPDVLRRIPALAAQLGRSLEGFVARRFTHPVLRQILGYPAVFLGTRPSSAPALYHLMSALDLDDGVHYPMGGFHQVVCAVERMARSGGARIDLGRDVVRIVTEGGTAARVSGVVWRDADGAEHVEPADVVISGADLHHTETHLLHPSLQTYPEAWWRRRTSGPGAVIVLAGVRGEVSQLSHHSLLFTRDWDGNFAPIFDGEGELPDPTSLYVCKPSATDPSVAPAGHENLFILVPCPPDTSIGRGGRDGGGDPRVEEIADAAIRQIAAWTDTPDLPERIVVRETIGPADFAARYHSWRGGMLGPAHILSQSAMFRAQNHSKKVAGLYYAGATVAPGVGVPMCLISAELVIKHLRGDASAGPLPEAPLARAGALAAPRDASGRPVSRGA